MSHRFGCITAIRYQEEIVPDSVANSVGSQPSAAVFNYQFHNAVRAVAVELSLGIMLCLLVNIQS